MFKNKKRFGIILIFQVLFLISQSPSFAQYEVIKAQTVGNENIVKKEAQPEIETFNDPELPNFSPDDNLGTLIEKKTRNFFNRKNKEKGETAQEEFEEEVNSETETVYRHPSIQEDDEEVNNKNKFQINADKINYNDDEGNVYASGNVEIIAKAQDLTLKSDEAVLDRASQTIKLYNNVKVIKNGVEMTGEYLLVDLNEQNILMDNPTVNAYSFIINAQESYLIANDLQMINGTIKSNQQKEIILESSGFQRYENVAVDYIKNRSMTRHTDIEARKQTYKIDAKEIVLTSYKDHNTILLKGSNVYYNRHKIINNSDIEIISDKQRQTVETNTPEAGNLRNFGTYIGYGFAFRMPKGHTLKLLPALTYGDSNIGVGLIGRYRSPNSLLEAGYATSTTNLVVRGKYRLSDGLTLRYGRNAYITEGFMGSRRSGYAAQLDYQKTYFNRDLGVRFNHGFYAGLFSDYRKHDQEEAYATTRFRYMAELRKTFFKYENEEQDMAFSFGAMAQGAATVYGSGETFGLARIGPIVTTRLKFWESSLGYLIAGTHGDSPFIFDKYRYGKSSIMLNEKIHLTDKFALGFRATVSPLKDNYEEDLLTESRFYAIFGPQDLKFVLSYDFVRDIAHFDMMFILGTDSSRINFEKLTTKNMDGGDEKRDFYKNAKPIRIKRPEKFDEEENI